MNAGRELDALIAERVFDRRVHWWGYDYQCLMFQDTLDRNDERYERGEMMFGYPADGDVPTYSTDIAAAWEVVEQFCNDRAVLFEISYDARGWHVDTASAQGRGSCLVAETASLAICLGILKAYGVEIDQQKDKQK